MYVKDPAIEQLALSHLMRKQNAYQGHYAKMRKRWGAEAADQVIRDMCLTLRTTGYNIAMFPTSLPRQWFRLRA